MHVVLSHRVGGNLLQQLKQMDTERYNPLSPHYGLSRPCAPGFLPTVSSDAQNGPSEYGKLLL